MAAAATAAAAAAAAAAATAAAATATAAAAAAAATAVPAVGLGVARIVFFLANYFPFSEGSKGGWTLGANTPFATLSFLPPKKTRGGLTHPPGPPIPIFYSFFRKTEPPGLQEPMLNFYSFRKRKQGLLKE